MKPPGESQFLLKLFLLLIPTTNLVTSADRLLLPNEKAEILRINNVGELQDTNTPSLLDFTVCLDLNRENNSPQTAFSYCVGDGEIPSALRLGFSADTIQILCLGFTYTVPYKLKLYTWHTFCLTRKSITSQLELFINGKSVYTSQEGNGNDPLKGRGSLVLGSDHSRNAGKISYTNNFVGTLYNFQMWSYSRSPNEMYDCSDGNLLSWTKELWNFSKIRNEENLRCANVTDKPSSTEKTTTLQTTPTKVTEKPTTTKTTTFRTTTTNLNDKPSSIEKTTTLQTTSTKVTEKPSTAEATMFRNTTTNVNDKPFSTEKTTTIQKTSTKVTEKPSTAEATTFRTTTTNVTDKPSSTEKTTTLQTTSTKVTEKPSTAEATTFRATTTNVTVKPSSTEKTTTFQTTTTNVTDKPSSTETPTFHATTTKMTNEPSSTETTRFHATTNLPPSTSTTTLDRNLSSTETLKGDTSPPKVTPAPDLYTTTVTEIGTTSTKSPGSQTTDQPDLPDSSTQSSTAESFPGNNIINSSIILPTGNNVSTTENVSSSHPIYPTTTTSFVPVSPWVNHTTIQPVTTYNTLGTTPSNVTTSSGTLPITTAVSSSVPDTKAATTKDPEVSSTLNVKSKSTEPPAGNLTSTIIGTAQGIINATTTVSSTSPSSPSQPSNNSVANTLPSLNTSHTLSTTLSEMTESLVSQSGFTNNTTSDYSKTPGPATTVTYFVVNMTIKFSDVVTDGDVATSLVKSMMDTFQVNNRDFSVLEVTVSEGPSYISKVIIQTNSSGDPQSLAVRLRNLLENLVFEQGNIIVSVQSVSLKALEKCPAETKQYDEFTYMWMETNPTETAKIQCYTNPDEFVSRYCSISLTMDSAEWENPDFSRCVLLIPLPNSFEDLDNVAVTPENAQYLAEHILNMTQNAEFLPVNDVRIILSKISDIIALEDIDVENAKIHLNVINDILAKANDSLNIFTNQILHITEEIGFKMNFDGESANITVNTMAILVSNVNFSRFEDFYFTVNSYQEGKNLEISLEKPPTNKAVASIYLPDEIQDQAGSAAPKVQFSFLGSLSLFEDSSFSKHELNTYVISATVEGANIQNLDQPVIIELQHVNENKKLYPVKCVFWDITKNGNTGGWSESGCSRNYTNANYTVCKCSHLTHFGVLLDLSRGNINPWDEYIMSLITYVGCGITSIFLGITLVTYGMFKQLRRDYPSKILMNLSFSLLMLNLIFLLNDWLSAFRIQGMCISVAALLHYFLLTSFTWMGLEAVHMYFAFVKVFNSYIHRYILKLCIAGWGIPTVVVVAVLSINYDFYGGISNSKETDPENDSLFCWIQNDTIFYVTVVAYFCIIFLTNIAMFIVVLLQIKSLKATKIKDWKALFLHDIKNTLSLAFLLGLTWGFAFFAWDPVRVAFLYLFTIFNTLQGFFIFVFHCLIKENVRKHWRMYLCCGRCRLDNYTDWSRLSNGDTKYHGRIHLSPSDSYQSTRSNNTASTNSSSLSGFSRDGYSAWTYGNRGGIFINSAHAGPSNRAAIHPDSRRTLSFLEFGTQ